MTEYIFTGLVLLFLAGYVVHMLRGALKEDKDDAEAKKTKVTEAEEARKAALVKRQEEVAAERLVEQKSKALAATTISRFEVSNGRGADRDTVIIEIDWRVPAGHDARLELYRSEYVCTNRDSVEGTASRKLDFEIAGQSLRFIDSEVDDRATYYYYAWIRHLWPGEREFLAPTTNFQKRSHFVRFGETFADLAKRRVERLKHEAQLRAAEAGVRRKAEPPPMPPAKRELVDEALELAGSLLKAKKSTEQLYARLDAWCEAQDLSDEDAEVIKEEVLRQLDGKTR